jgi:enoyl-CoA hydratase/carnithine racemase
MKTFMSKNLHVDLDKSQRWATITIDHPPHNYFTVDLMRELGDVYFDLENNPDAYAIILRSEGRHFCAGADFSQPGALDEVSSERGFAPLYEQASRLFSGSKPVIAVVQGGAIGGGLGLALSADFRCAAPSSRFVANFAALGLHPGFALSITLPRLVGEQRALELFYTGRPVMGAEALAIGLCDRLAEESGLLDEAYQLAQSIVSSAPLAVGSIRTTMRRQLHRSVAAAMEHENNEQRRLGATSDFLEGIAAAREKRSPKFKGE